MHLHTISQHHSTIDFVCHTNSKAPDPRDQTSSLQNKSITYNDTFAGGTIVFFVYTFYSNNLLKWSNTRTNYRLRLLKGII